MLLVFNNRSPELEFVRVDYNLERTVGAMQQSELPDEFPEYLRTSGMPRPSRLTTRSSPEHP